MADRVGMNYQTAGSQCWSPSIDGDHVNAIRRYLMDDGIPGSGVDKIVENAAKTIGYCPDPSDNEIQQSTGIVIGKVQSGKTSNFITSIALAFDNDYSVVVVLGGTKNVLVGQNRDRLKEYFRGVHDVTILDSNEQKSELQADRIFNHVCRKRKVVIVALKTPKMIKTLRENIFSDKRIQQLPILIIDDEGDEASLNTLVFKGKESSTYRAIRELKETLPRHCFLSITATPQANLLIDAVDVLSPDFGVLVEPGEGYCGLEVFHSDGRYTREISEEEQTILDDGIPGSFCEALASFFVACGIRRYWGMKHDEHLSMLVHPSNLKSVHAQVLNKTNAVIDDWRNLAKDTEDIAYEELRNRLLSAYEYYRLTIENLPQYKQLPSFETLEQHILFALQFCQTHLVNGDSVPNRADENYEFNIYVGGSMLGRGLTLSGLAITYIIRTSTGVSNVDTVQQRARWFGYKMKYLPLCRIYAVHKILGEFRDIRDHEEDLWYTIEHARLEGIQFKNIARVFTLSDGLRATRANVARTERFLFNSWTRQRFFQFDPDYSNCNMDTISKFMELHPTTEMKFGSGEPFKVASSIPFTVVREQLLIPFYFPEMSALNAPIINKLSELLKRKALDPLVDVVWMRYTDTSVHQIGPDGKIPNYSVGRRPKDLSLPQVYAGDDYQFSKDDRIVVQIHNIQDKETKKVSPTLSLHLPTSVIEKLTNLVLRA